ALDFCSNEYIITHYLLPFPAVLKWFTEPLSANGAHWNPTVRERSDELFDFFLDYM
ncbi:unnamed protein product, partial [Heterosigma akashiwo]